MKKLLSFAEMRKIAESSTNPTETFNELWAQNQALMNEKPAPVVQRDVVIDITPTPAVPKKPVVHVGDASEKAPGTIAKRTEQGWQVLRAFLNKPEGYTDAELVSARIGGTDGPRGRRRLRQVYGVGFFKRLENGISRWSLSNRDHASQVLKYKRRVEVA